ncbi:DUF6691 family protein [Deltaproteobacteria bacterium TL4]
MKVSLVSFFSGVCFSVGLSLGGMTQPEKIISFLDVTGTWDPSLLFVMVGAIVVYSVVYHYAIKQPSPFFSDHFSLPTLKKVDSSLVLGSALFGVGWGVSGFCPGPALASIVVGTPQVLVFVLFMAVGMYLAWFFKKGKTQPQIDADKR